MNFILGLMIGILVGMLGLAAVIAIELIKEDYDEDEGGR